MMDAVSAPDATPPPEVRVYSLLARSLRALLARPVAYLLVALAATAPYVLLAAPGIFAGAWADTVREFMATQAEAIGVVIANVAGAAVTFGAVAGLTGAPARSRAILGTGARKVLAVAPVWLAVSALEIAAYRIHPILGTLEVGFLAVAVPAAVIEGSGVWPSMRRSVRLTTGRRWRVVGAFIALGLVQVYAVRVIDALGSETGVLGLRTLDGMDVALSVFTGLFVATWYAVLLATAFHELRAVEARRAGAAT